MKPLIVLLIVFLVSIFAIKLLTQKYDLPLSARIGMCAMLLFSSIGHFAFTKGMTMMIPGFIPFKTQIVYLTGIIEIIAAVGLLIPPFKVLTGWLLIIFFVLLLPANINAAIHNIDFQKGNATGNGLGYLWFRVPLQIVFILWTYISAIRF